MSNSMMSPLLGSGEQWRLPEYAVGKPYIRHHSQPAQHSAKAAHRATGTGGRFHRPASQFARRREASAMSSAEPANESRTQPPPSIGSKSRPGVSATPVSARRRRQNSALSRLWLEMSI